MRKEIIEPSKIQREKVTIDLPTKIQREKVTIDLPNIGLGTHRTSASYIYLLLLLENDRHDRIRVLESVLEALGIHPEEIIHVSKQPCCSDEKAYRRWALEYEELKKTLGIKED